MKKIVSFVFVVCGIYSGNSFAQWKSDSTTNTAVCTAINSQQNPRACTDESNGVIVVWEDFRSGTDWDIYAQKLNADGVAQWKANGINICTSSANQTAPVICSDGSGGAYIVWKDTRTAANGTDLYGQHINSDGSLSYGSSGTGIAVAADAVAPNNISICADGSGNAFVAWEDSRTSISPANTRPDIWMNKLTPFGAAWGGSYGTSIISQSLHQTMPQVTADGTGGCYLVWVNQTLPASIWGTRVSSGGTVLWGTTGNEIFIGGSGTTDASRNPNISLDGSQLCVSWEQYDGENTTNGWNIRANRVNSDGSLVWGTATTAPEISTNWTGDQINSVVFSDDSLSSGNIAGLLVVYEDYTVTHDIVMTRLLPDGNALRPAFPYQLFSVCRVNNDQTFPKAVKTGSGEILIVWNDTRSNVTSSTYSSIYAQRCDNTPKRFIGPSPSVSSWGQPVSNRAGSNADQVVLVPRTNGGIAVWRDNRNGNTDIYAQLIFRDGSLPIELSSFSLSSKNNGNVLLNWQTASEKNTAGFEVERRLINNANASNNFEVVGSYLSESSLNGAGFSNSPRNYSYLDNPGKPGVYEYRLADYSLNGERTIHDSKTIELFLSSATGGISVGQNMPNPFSDKTLIPISVSQTAIVECTVADILGRVIATPVHSIIESGSHSITLNSSSFGNSSPSGAYYYSITITDPQTGSVLWKMPKAMMMIKIAH